MNEEYDYEYVPFVIGDVRLKNDLCTPTEMQHIIKKIEQVMIEHGVIKLDLAINPFAYPKDLINYGN